MSYTSTWKYAGIYGGAISRCTGWSFITEEFKAFKIRYQKRFKGDYTFFSLDIDILIECKFACLTFTNFSSNWLFLVYWNVQGMVSIDNVTVVSISTLDELNSIIRRGSEQRHTSGTSTNEHSSRSHVILSIVVESTNLQTQSVARGKVLFLVTLYHFNEYGYIYLDGIRLKSFSNRLDKWDLIGIFVSLILCLETT